MFNLPHHGADTSFEKRRNVNERLKEKRKRHFRGRISGAVEKSPFMKLCAQQQ